MYMSRGRGDEGGQEADEREEDGDRSGPEHDRPRNQKWWVRPTPTTQASTHSPCSRTRSRLKLGVRAQRPLSPGECRRRGRSARGRRGPPPPHRARWSARGRALLRDRRGEARAPGPCGGAPSRARGRPQATGCCRAGSRREPSNDRRFHRRRRSLGRRKGLTAALNPAMSCGGGRVMGLGDPDFASRALRSLPAGHRGHTTPLIR